MSIPRGVVLAIAATTIGLSMVGEYLYLTRPPPEPRLLPFPPFTLMDVEPFDPMDLLDPQQVYSIGFYVESSDDDPRIIEIHTYEGSIKVYLDRVEVTGPINLDETAMEFWRTLGDAYPQVCEVHP